MVERPEPRIYVASLSDYNAGRLHGIWIDAARDADALLADIHAMLTASTEPLAEEYAIHDYEGFSPFQVGEYESIERVAAVARGIATHGEAYAVWVSSHEIETDHLDGFDDAYVGHWESVHAYAESLVEDLGIDVGEFAPEHLRPYVSFDTDAFARDLQIETDIVEGPDGTAYVFEPQG